jgi:arginine repressor
MKQKRQAKILELIESYDIGTQEDMLRYLRDSGYDMASEFNKRLNKEIARRTVYPGNAE